MRLQLKKGRKEEDKTRQKMEKKCQRKYELIGAGAATIALAGAAVGIGNVLSSLIHSVARNPSLLFSSLVTRLCSNRSYCIVCPFDLIRILIVS